MIPIKLNVEIDRLGIVERREISARLEIHPGGLCQSVIFDEPINLLNGDKITIPGWHVQISNDMKIEQTGASIRDQIKRNRNDSGNRT
jgi:hypothetical protein